MVAKKTWAQFRECGLLWWINIQLHMFGWAIVIELNSKGEIKTAYPARVKFRGFDVKSNTDGYQKVSKYLEENAITLNKEAHE